jgi:hypothetical protein
MLEAMRTSTPDGPPYIKKGTRQYQIVPDFTNIFHTLRTKLGNKDSEHHLVLKYCGCFHRYIQTEIGFLDITSLGMTYRYVVNIKHKFKKKRCEFGSANPSQPKQGKGNPNPHKNGPSRDGHPQENPSKPKHRKRNKKMKKDTGKWCEYHKSPWTTLTNAAPRSPSWSR